MTLTKTQARMLATGLGLKAEKRARIGTALVFVLGFVLGSLLTASFNLFS